MNSRTLRAAVLGTTILVACPLAALAQASDNAETVESVVVSGEKFGAGQGRATFELSKEDIDSRPLGADITQALNKVPGIESSTGDSRGGSFSFELYLRGLNEQQIGFSVDGIPTGDARFNGGSPPQRFIDSSNIGNIVVSQSAGDIGSPSRFALGGSIDFQTDAPKQTFGGVVEGGVGSDAYQREYIRLDSGEIAPGLSMYATYDHQYNDNWATPNSAHDEREHYEIKVVKMFENGSFLKGHVSYNNEFNNDFDIVTLPQFLANPRSDGATDALTGVPNTDVNYGGAFGGARKDVMAYVNAGLQIDDDIQLTANPYYQTLSGFSLSYQNSQRTLAGGNPYAVTSYNATGGAVRPAVTTVSTPAAFGGPVDLRVTPRLRERYGLTDELKVKNFLLPENTLRIGTWWEGGNSTENRNFYHILNAAATGLQTSPNLSYVQYARSTTIETTNFYAQDSWQIIPDTLRLDAGVSWFFIKYKAASPLEYNARLNFHQNSPLLPKIAISYKPIDHVEVFGGFAKNFAGISEDAFLGSTAVITPNSIKPTQTENYDLGVRYTADWYTLSLQGYNVLLKNAIGIVPNDPTVTDPFEIMRGNVATKAANIPGQHFSGIELAGQAKWNMFDIYASYSYQHATYANAPVGSALRLVSDSVAAIPGTPVRDIPSNSGYIELGVSPLDGLRLAGTVRYETSRVGGDIVAPTTFAEVGVERIPGYAQFGLQARYTLPDFDVVKGATLQFNVDNLTDAAYLSSVTEATATQAELGLPGRSLQRYFVAAPRTFTFSVRAPF
jgi:outer membrane receptor for ferrienterochelin and colicin